MKPTIRNKLVGGLSCLLLVILGVAAIGGFSVFSLRRDALQAVRVGARLNAESLEIQVHTLHVEAQVGEYLAAVKIIGVEKARRVYLDEVEFEENEIQNLAVNLIRIAPTEEARSKFTRTAIAVIAYMQALENVVKASGKEGSNEDSDVALAAYTAAATHLREAAEDGQVAGHEASLTAQERIETTIQRSGVLVFGVSLFGLILALGLSVTLSRAILVPVQHLKDVAENVSLGNLDLKVHRFSDDEIGDLADSFSRMVTAVRFFRSEAEAFEAEAGAQREG
ncbi:MAG TPA: HAMP domain-containing protein [Candidatus Acidoferrales bacterium]|nr:HAMP domain-containing protein [Candidatus Acidoferrales bacterium]